MPHLSPGVCLTYDDLSVENWCAAREIFDEYNAKATFAVTMLHTATQEQLDGLHQLQEDGHEIGFHTRTHPRLAPYLEKHGLQHWVENELDAGIAEHRALGFPARSFAFPFHSFTPHTRREAGHRFSIVRAAGAKPGFSFDRAPRRIYRERQKFNAVHNLGPLDFQTKDAGDWNHTCGLLDMVRAYQGVGIFSGHDIRAQIGEPGLYCTHDQLRRFLDEVSTRGLTFYTLSGFADQLKEPSVG